MCSFSVKETKRFFPVLFLLFVLLFLLSGCSSSAKSENSVAEDLQSDSRFFAIEEITITDFTIEKRLTIKEDRVDTVWITVTASNENISCTLSYIMTYHLYNSGWILDEVDRDYEGTWVVEPQHRVSDDIIQENINMYTSSGTFDTMEIVNGDMWEMATTPDGNTEYIIRYLATKEHLYGQETMYVEQYFYFDSDTCQYISADDLSIYDRSLVLNDSIVNAEWTCGRNYNAFDVWPDRFTFKVTDLFEENSEPWIKFEIYRERNTYWEPENSSPVHWGVETSFAISSYLKYIETEGKWGFNMEDKNDFLYAEDDGKKFTASDWFCFDLDQAGAGYITTYDPV